MTSEASCCAQPIVTDVSTAAFRLHVDAASDKCRILHSNEMLASGVLCIWWDLCKDTGKSALFAGFTSVSFCAAFCGFLC